MRRKNEIPDFSRMAETLKADAVRFAARTGVNFFQDAFFNQGFTDTSFQPWPKRKDDFDPGRKVLVKSSALLNSIRVFEQSNERIVFGSDEEHAPIHNDGGTISVKVTAKSRKFFWAMFKATGNSMFKAMALTKKDSFRVVIPKRQFIGESATLMGDLDSWIAAEINKRFSKT